MLFLIILICYNIMLELSSPVHAFTASWRAQFKRHCPSLYHYGFEMMTLKIKDSSSSSSSSKQASVLPQNRGMASPGQKSASEASRQNSRQLRCFGIKIPKILNNFRKEGGGTAHVGP